MAAAVLIPAAVPFLALVVRVGGDGAAALDVLWSARTLRLIGNTTALVAAVSVSDLVIGIGAAWLTTRTDLPWRRGWAVLAALPLVIPSYVIAMALRSAFGPRGLLADLTGIGFPIINGFPGAWLALTVATYPFVYLVAAAAMRKMGRSQEEAARGLGAGRWRVFRTVILPHLRPSVSAGVLLAALYTLSDFGAVSLMRFDAFTRVVYAQYAGRLDRTTASVLAVILVGLAAAVLVLEQRTRGRAAYHTPAPEAPAPPVPLSGVGRLAGTGILAALAAVSLLLPIGVLATWLGKGGGAPIPWGAVAGSIAGAGAAALVAGLAAAPVSVLVVRHRSRASAWVERVSYALFALPHLTVALAVVFFASRWLGGLYQSLMLLVLVYTSIFFAQALAAGRAALLQVNPHLEEASRGLGRGALATMVGVTVPLVWRGLAAGALLVFLTTMKELPATLLLRPTGFDTLAVGIWSAADNLQYAAAAAPALLLIAVSAVPAYLLAARSHDR
ncbi:MAG: iron ABC transporter permease [Actinomycetota bacterium]